jgi:glycosyltransferase involved in cell wall biosynthesis
MHKISIAIPTSGYKGNGDKYLDDLLESIRKQTYRNFNIVISDHCQDSLIEDKISEFSDMEILYHKNPNNIGNSPLNLNRAIDLCDGEIIKIMFQDDVFFSDNSLEIIATNLENSGKMWLLNGCNHMDDGINIPYEPMVPRYNPDLLIGTNTISSPSVLAIKKECEVRFDGNLTYFMDVEYYHAMWEKYGDPVIIDETLITNRNSNNSISGSINDWSEISNIEREYCRKKYNR